MGVNGEIYSPEMDKHESKKQLNTIGDDHGTVRGPGTPWLAVQDSSIVSVQIMKVGGFGVG